MADGPFPALVFVHGFTGFALAYMNLLTEVASHGYVVIAADEPLTNRNAPGGPFMLDVRNQPGDVSFLTGQAARLNVVGPLAGMVDGERVGVGGHSLGAITTLMATYNTCCADDRIDAAIALAGAAVFGPPEGRWFRGSGAPLLMVHGEDDPL
ncbi:MAG TPA: hypothetical protein VM618_03090, partial [Acidimicrobiia bacterium]|nr:hypothetical protein [Acidimicrobiia bacterium]